MEDYALRNICGGFLGSQWLDLPFARQGTQGPGSLV